MSDPVPRTVAEIGEDGVPVKRQPTSDDRLDWGDVLAGEDSTDWSKVLAGEDSRSGSEDSLTLEEFRESDAFVLLGPPGSGKTTLFETVEAKRAGCHYVTARNFLTLGEKPEWREPDATLFIDGLDEKRAGSQDGRTPLDDIRAKLDSLGRPRFRLSCREADWFGSNDRTHLETVSRDGRLKVLRLDPLSDEGIHALLNRRPDVDDADAFIDEARKRGIDHLLTNPQNLEMLADAVSGGAWPRTRIQTFELACEKLVQELNSEHQLANRNGPATPELLAAAERLCAIQLLTGHTGYDVSGHPGDPQFLGLKSIPGDDRRTVRLTLNTRLFKRPEEGEGRRIPEHRQVAEFLAARYLTRLIDDGLPVGRVLALMTGEDGGIVSELRGLSAWLAAHCLEARRELIERDPEGIAAYGDAGVFTLAEKRHLLELLQPLSESLDASLLTFLATPDMVPVLVDCLTDRKQNEEHQELVVFLLCVLANAAPLPELGGVLYRVAASDDRSARCRRWASICLAMGARKQPERYGDVIHRLLSGLRYGRVRDDGKRMLGELLEALYPTFIGPSEVFRYREVDRGGADTFGNPTSHYEFFWRHDLADASRPEDLEIILDKIGDIFDRSEAWKMTGELPDSALAQAAGTLVANALDRLGDQDLKRTFRWLRLVGGEGWADVDSLNAIRDWIEARPKRYNELVREGVTQCLKTTDFNACVMRIKEPLRGARTPTGYGRWCLDEVNRAEKNEDLARFWFKEAWFALRHQDGADGLTGEQLESIAAGIPDLADVQDKLRSLDEKAAEQSAQIRQRMHVRQRERKEALVNRRRFFRRYEEALRENRCPAGALNSIAEAFLGGYLHIEGESGEERLRELLGDDTLVEAAMEGLRGAIHRDDLPTPKEVVALRVDNQRHLLAFPVVAGLELVSADDIPRLEDERARLAVAMFLASRPPSPEPRWVRRLFESRPDLAAEEVVRFAAMAIRRGEHDIPFIGEVLSYTWLSEVARLMCPKLLRAFPVRAPRHQFNVLKRLLWWGADNLEASAMEPIVAAKLTARSMTAVQRAYWLATQLAVSDEPDPAEVEAFAEKHANALSGFFVFYEQPPRQRSLLGRLPSPSLGRMARLLGASRRPLSAVHSEPAKFRESDLVRVMLEGLGMGAEDDALRALAALGNDSRMAAWHTIIQRVQQEQRVVRRDASYRHPDVDAVVQSLECGQPANTADLLVLAVAAIEELANEIRDGSTDGWKDYWNVDSHGHAQTPRPENLCRDTLIGRIRSQLHGLGINVVREGSHAMNTSSDIQFLAKDLSVPVEIKRSSHRNLWSAIRNQLIAKYTRDPGAGGYGIYLVFWFGNDPDACQMPESGSRPRSAAELEERLRGTLSSEEARLISICVIDVGRP